MRHPSVPGIPSHGAQNQRGNTTGTGDPGAAQSLKLTCEPITINASAASIRVRDPATITFSASDNIGLSTAFPTLTYGGIALRSITTLFFGGSGRTFVASSDGEFTVSLPVRCIASQPPSAVSVTVLDLARLTGSAVRNLGPSQVESCGSVGNVPFYSFGVSPTPASVSRSSGTTTLTVDIGVPLDNVISPVSQVLFYQFDGSVFRPIGVGAITMVQTATDRRWYYKLVWDPSDTVPIGNVSVLALLVDEDGDAVPAMTTVNVTP